MKIGAPGRWEVPRSLFKTDNITLGVPGRRPPLHASTHSLRALLCSRPWPRPWLWRLTPPAPPAEDPLSGGPAIYNLSVSSSPFGIAVARAGAAPGDAPLFDTTGHRLIFKVLHRLDHAHLRLPRGSQLRPLCRTSTWS